MSEPTAENFARATVERRALTRLLADDVESASMINYETFALKSAVYPGQGHIFGLLYCALKLNGEAGEVAEDVGKLLRDGGIRPDSDITELTGDQQLALLQELGDVLWYITAAANELGYTLQDVAVTNLIKLADRYTGDADDQD